MATRIRLARYGAKKRPFYRIVVTDQRTPSGRRKLEQLGTYDPRKEPLEVRLDADKLRHWLDRGAEPSETVARLIKRSGVLNPGAAATAPPADPPQAPAPEAAPADPPAAEEPQA